jgi:hypothetical protein
MLNHKPLQPLEVMLDRISECWRSLAQYFSTPVFARSAPSALHLGSGSHTGLVRGNRQMLSFLTFTRTPPRCWLCIPTNRRIDSSRHFRSHHSEPPALLRYRCCWPEYRPLRRIHDSIQRRSRWVHGMGDDSSRRDAGRDSDGSSVPPFVCFWGSWFSIPMGLLIAGVCIPAAVGRLLPKWLIVFGLLLAVAGELSWFNLVFPQALFLIPLVRFPGFIWLIATGFLLPKNISVEQSARYVPAAAA